MTDIALSAPATYAQEKSAQSLDAGERRKLLRKRLFILFGALLVVGAAAYGGWWLWLGQRYISTDDAYVAADSAAITPQVAGTIRDVLVTDTMHVKRGDILVRLDPADSELAYAQGQANYAQAVRRVRQYFANAAQAEAQVVARGSDLKRATLDYHRRVVLAQGGWIANEQLTTQRNTFETASADLTAAQQTLAAQQALITGADVDHNPEVLAAKAALERARLDLARTVIRAPIDGVVAQNSGADRSARAGRPDPDERRAGGSRLCRRQFQGRPANARARRTERDTHVRSLRLARCFPRRASKAWAAARARPLP